MKIISHHIIAPEETLTEEQIVQRLLKIRNIEDMNAFMEIPDPQTLRLKDFGFNGEVDQAMSLLKQLKEEKKRIVVYTDYDADGITGGSILWETLHLMGFDVMPYVPHRQTEGYGFSKTGIDTVKKQFDPALIISVDHGIAAIDQIAYAKELGISVIVTDHHAKQATLPDAAFGIFHIPQLSGSSVAYYVAKEVFETLAQPTDPNYQKLKDHFACDYLALAAIGTVADLVPLTGRARGIAKHGIQAFTRIKRVGIKHIMAEAKIGNKPVDTFHIGFIIAPRINAIGRLEHALDALRLLCTSSSKRAMELASKIGSLNESRKDLVKEAVAEANEMVKDMIVDGNVPNIIILKNDHWHEGIIGLIASDMLEKYHRPVFVITKSEHYLKGSARSPATVHLTEFLSQFKSFLLNFGGHKQAAGFSIEESKYELFKKAAEAAAAAEFNPEDLVKVIEADIDIPLNMVSLKLIDLLKQFEPFGVGNPRPTFVCKAELLNAMQMGKNSEHLKLVLHQPQNTAVPLEVVAFRKGSLYHELKKGQEITAVFHLDCNEWNGRKKVQGIAVHIE